MMTVPESHNNPKSEATFTLSIDDLRRQWHQLDDLSRAEALAALLSGKSVRQLAKEVGQAPSSVRYLLHLADATPDEKKCLRERTISSRKIHLRVRARRAQQQGEANVHELETVIGEHLEAAAEIVAWLKGTGCIPGNVETILNEARTILSDRTMESADQLRRSFPTQELGKAASLVELGDLPPDPVKMVRLRSIWLCQWLVKRYADPQDWIVSLNLAKEDYMRGHQMSRR